MKKLLLLMALFGLSFSYSQTTVTLNPSQDNSIYSESNNSNGVGRLFAGQNNMGNNRRALLQFDLSAIPSTATITSVSLTLTVDQVSASVTNNFNLHRLTTAWGEGTSTGGGAGASAIAPDATWSDAMLGTTNWTTAGGDYINTASQSLGIEATTGAKTFLSNAGLIMDVQNWVNGTNTNAGWILIGDETTINTTRRFGSKDQGTAPVLSITYSEPTTVVLMPMKDNSMYQSSANNSNGAGMFLFSGLTCASSSRRALMQFDVSSIPSDATILSVSLSVNSNRSGLSATASDVYALHRVTTDWGEGASNENLGLGAPAQAPDATWNNAMTGSSAWTTPGGDFIGTPSSSATFVPTGISTIPTSANLVADVQNWIDGVQPNYGWILIGSESNPCTARRFASRENASNQPMLTITYDNETLSTPNVAADIQGLRVFPNPSDSGIFNLKTTTSIQHIEVYNTLGTSVKTMTDFSSDNYTVDLSQHSNGMYFLKIQDIQGNTIVKRVIRQ